MNANTPKVIVQITCPQCGREFTPINSQQKYCRYEMVKYGKGRTVSRCRVSHNNAVNHYRHPRDRREYYKAKREEWASEGICVCCGSNKTEDNLRVCDDCLEKQRTGYI